MARPPKAPQDRRTEQVKIVLSPTELARVKAKADRAENTVTAFVRAAALGKPVKVEQTSAPDFMTRNELRRIGVNLNQIAHALNSGRGHSPAELRSLCAKLDQLFDRWLDHGSQDRTGRPQL